MDFIKKNKKSRLARIEEKRQLRQAAVFAFATLVLLLFILFRGIPGLIKLAEWFTERKTAKPNFTKEDLIPPLAPIIEIPFEATSTPQINLKGISEPSSLVRIIINNEQKKETKTDDNGQFLFTSISLRQGVNTFKAKAIDNSQNESDYSKEFVIIFDDQAPQLEITQPNENEHFFEKNKEIKIEGNVNETAVILINNRIASLDQNGNFSLYYELKDGENNFEIIAEDKAGNKTKKNLKVFYTP